MRMYEVTTADGQTKRIIEAPGSAVSTNYSEITKEEYDRYKAMEYRDFTKEIESNLSPSIIWGYGYYGCCLMEYEGAYWLGIKTGNSCD